MRKALVISGIALLSLAAACSLAPRNTGSAYMFALRPAAEKVGAGGTLRLDVAFPKAAPELDTARIAILKDRKTWDYYAGARWADFVPVMVQDNLVKTLDASGLFRSVAPDAGPTADEVLKVEIRQFHAEYQVGRAAPVIRIALQATLADRREMKVLTTFAAGANQPAADDSFPAILSAFQKAFLSAEHQVAEQIRKSSR